MAEKPNDLYGTFGDVPSVLPSGGASYLNVRANPEDFGGQVGGAVENLGGTTAKVGNESIQYQTELAQQATEAKVNDVYANQYAPAAADLRNQYDQLQGQDKIPGYQSYISGLQDLNKNFTGNTTSPYEKQLMGGLIDRHISGEIDGAKRELVQSQIQFSDRATADKVEADSGYAVSNFNNPGIANQVKDSNDATILMHYMNRGYDPNTPQHAAVIEQAQNEATGKMATGMIGRALATGDAQTANALRAQYAENIPGYQQLAIDNTLHAENMRQTGTNGASALRNGQPLPPTVGAPPAHVQAVVADTAQDAGIDPNHALTVAMIESNMGQNLGKRGDVGQTGKGGDLPTQASNMVDALKKSQTVADAALGRKSEPWEQYACYQQGAAGGPALLKASTDDPAAKAVDVLRPLYKNPKDAYAAIVNNGGNATMTAGDYLNFVHKKYDANAQRAMCEVSTPPPAEQSTPEGGQAAFTEPQPASLGQALMDPHQQTGEVVQPAANPHEMLMNFDQKFPAMLDRAQAIPNIQVRESVMRNLKQDRENLSYASQAFSSQLVNQAQNLAAKGTFTSMDQVPSDMAASLLEYHPETMRYLERSAQRNLDKASGGASEDMKKYGSGMFKLLQSVHDGSIQSTTELMKHLPSDSSPGDLTLAGYDRLTKEFSKDPESKAEATMKSQAFKVIKGQLSGTDDGLGLKDPKGEELFLQAMPKLFQAIDDGKSKGLSAAQLYDPTSKDWIGNTVQGLRRSATQMSIDMMSNTGDKPSAGAAKPSRTLEDIVRDAQDTNDPQQKEKLRQEAIHLGFIRDNTPVSSPEAPISR